VADRLISDKLLQVAAFGRAYWRIADRTCSATTLRLRRDELIALGLMDQVEHIAREGYDRMVGLQLEDKIVDGCITKAPCGGEMAGRSPVDRAKRGTKRSRAVDGEGIPLGVLAAPANRHDPPLLAPTPDALSAFVSQPVRPPFTSTAVTTPWSRALSSIAGVWQPASRSEALRHRSKPPLDGWWCRTDAWHNAFRKLAWCAERRGVVIRFLVALANTIIIVRWLVREAWKRNRWDTRSRGCP